jgi:EAL domain-containing protein (putative c-di-GMP-specific phosphodiesterase class I)
MLTHAEPTTFTLTGAPYLEYLPVVDLSNGRLLGMEALVRWEHPTQGLISPNHLIPQAELSCDIGPLTRWILMEACEKARDWSPSIQLGVNCTIHQLRRGEVSKAVANALDVTGFQSGQLTLEVAEDAIVDSEAAADLRSISEMGVQLSVDDVGTNWSSFEPFKRNAISTVKIDGSFTAGLESTQGINRLVMETVIHMAHSLGMSAIVEWVETPAQVEIVRGFGADAAQGFFFSRPMSGEDARAFASGPGVPQFSCTAIRSLVVPGDGEGFLVSLDEDVAPQPLGRQGIVAGAGSGEGPDVAEAEDQFDDEFEAEAAAEAVADGLEDEVAEALAQSDLGLEGASDEPGWSDAQPDGSGQELGQEA